MKYLRKRHPLYFDVRKINEDQIVDLIKKIIFRLKSTTSYQSIEESAGKKENKKPVASPPKEEPKKSKIPMKTKKTFQNLTKANDEQKSDEKKPVSFSNGGNLPKIEE